MNTWLLFAAWVLLFAAGSYLGNRALDRRDSPLLDRFTFQGPITLVHSQRGLALVERLANATGAWRYWGGLGVAVSLTGLVLGFIMIVVSAVRIATRPETATISQPRNYLVIPGVNDFLPLDAAPELILALLIGMVVHEGGHAIFCRTGDIDIKSTGLALFALIPAGAFVEPDEQSQAQAPRWAQMKMVSAGIMNNIAVTVLALLLLVSPVFGMVAASPGAGVGGVHPGSPAEDAGLEAGDQIVAVEGVEVNTEAELESALSEAEQQTVTVTLDDGRTVTVERDAYITAVASASPDIPVGATIATVDGSEVGTADEFREALAATDGHEATVTLNDGETVRLPVGALIVPQPDRAAADAGLEAGEPLTVVSLDGERITSAAALHEAMATVDGGDDVSVGVLNAEGEYSEVTVSTETDDDGGALLGVAVTPGVSGVDAGDFGVGVFPAEQYLNLVRGDGLSTGEHLFALLLLPFGELVGLGHNFPGFTDTMQSFYTLDGVPAGAATSAMFFGLSLVFWSAWLNFNLALFNALPASLLDGGHLVRLATEDALDRAGFDPTGVAGRYIPTAIIATTVCAIAVFFIAPAL